MSNTQIQKNGMVGKIFIVSAPSGAGKSTLVAVTLENLKREWPIERVITYTTKKPRNNEVPGKDYHFIEVDDFERRITEGFFLEWSNAYGTYYGSACSIIAQMAHGHSYISIIDREGARQIKERYPEAILIWIGVPSFQELEQRLRGRGTEDDQQIERRLSRARIEMDLEEGESIYDHIIINDRFEVAQQELERLIVDYLLGQRLK